MSFAAVSLVFPVVLAVHNAEEYARYEAFVGAYRGRLAEELRTRGVVRRAMVLLTLSAAALDVLTYLFRSSALLTIARVAVFALMLNGIGHCVLSVKRRTVLPGTTSAPAFVLPYSVVAVVAMRSDFGGSLSRFVWYAFLGAIMQPIVMLLFLGISYGGLQAKQRFRVLL